MKLWKRIAIGAGVALLLGIIVGFAVHQSGKNVVTVQSGKVQRQELASVVSASGEIRPKTYVNIGANAFGKITRLYVKEGDHVKKGQLLAQLENVQSSAVAQKENSYYSYGKKKQGTGYQRKDCVTARGIARDFARWPCASPHAVSNSLRGKGPRR